MEEAFTSDGVRGVFDRPEHPTGGALALTHGDGADCHAPLLERVGRACAEAGLLVLRYDLPFRWPGPHELPAPEEEARDREGVVRAVEMLRAMVPGPVIAGGHSYGARQTAIAAAENPQMADALLLLAYPLYLPHRPEEWRTAFFPDWRTPALFVHGSRDPFGTLGEMRDALGHIPAPVKLLQAQGLGHDLWHPGLAQAIVERLRALVVF